MASNAWCNLAFWQMRTRVGRTYPVEYATVNIFGSEPPHGQGICLKNLAQHSFSPPESDVKTMCKIGLGMYLFIRMV